MLWENCTCKNRAYHFLGNCNRQNNPEVFNHYAEQEKSPEEIIQQEKAKKESQQTNPLYEDIHQIAGDLRFIKNYLIFCIVVGIIFGFIWAVSML